MKETKKVGGDGSKRRIEDIGLALVVARGLGGDVASMEVPTSSQFLPGSNRGEGDKGDFVCMVWI